MLKESDEFAEPQTRTSAPFAILCRTLRLRLLKLLFASRWDDGSKEEKKTAIHRNRFYAAIRCSVHVAPVTAACALVVLNSAQYYVGGELAGPIGQDDQKLNALQFAAKLHELLMIASLAAIVFTYIRRELIFGEGIPYGTLFAGLEIDNLSFLYSPELWSAVWARWQRRRKQCMLLSILIFSTLLGVSIGPSSANLMRPRLDDWPAGGTRYRVNAASNVIVPSQMVLTPGIAHCTQDTDDAACPHGDWRLLEAQFHSYWPRLEPMGTMPEQLSLSSALSSRTLVVRRRSTEDITRSIFSNAFTSATTQQSVIGDGLAEVGRYWAYAAANSGGRQKFVYRRDAIFTVTAPQPVTQTRCEETVLTALRLVNNLTFPILAQPTCDGDNAACHVHPVSYNTTTNKTLIDEVQDSLAIDRLPSVIWVDDDAARPENSSAVVVVAFPQTNVGDTRLYRCTIDARMANSSISTTRNIPKVVTGYAPEFKSVGTSNSSWPRVSITTQWAQTLNPTIPDAEANMTAFAHTVAAAGMWNSSSPAHVYNYPFIVESILSLMVTNGIARSTYNNTLVGNLKGPFDPSDPWRGGEWQRYMLPRHGLSFNGPQSIFEEPSVNDVSTTTFKMYARVTGYAWSSNGMIQKANIVVLMVYIIFACLHLVYSIYSGSSSSAWDTVPELVALAAQSQRSYAMHNTGAGIETMDPLKQKVSVRNIDGHLEYIFDDTYKKGSAVRANKRYS